MPMFSCRIRFPISLDCPAKLVHYYGNYVFDTNRHTIFTKELLILLYLLVLVQLFLQETCPDFLK